MASACPAEGAAIAPAGSLPAPELYTGLRPLRTLAMLSIVGYHVSWEPLFGVAFGLTCLQVVMCALACRRPRAAELGEFARKRARRLLVPWLFWSGVYALFELARGLQAGEAPGARFEGWMWASGTSFHLWFLPFAFVASLAVNRIQHGLRERRVDGVVAGLSLVGAGLAWVAAPLGAALELAMPFDLWLDGAPALAFGLALGRSLGLGEARARGLACVGLLSVLPYLCAQTLGTPAPLLARYAIAVPLACGATLVRLPDSKTLGLLASLNLGVYLVHMLVIRVVDHLPGAREWPAAPRTLAVYVACLLVVAALRRLRIPHVV